MLAAMIARWTRAKDEALNDEGENDDCDDP
jgi:hypothetical protein